MSYAAFFSIVKTLDLGKKMNFFDKYEKSIHDGGVVILLKVKYKQKIKNKLELIGILRKKYIWICKINHCI